MIPSTPMSISDCMVGTSFTVQTMTRIPAACASCTIEAVVYGA